MDEKVKRLCFQFFVCGPFHSLHVDCLPSYTSQQSLFVQLRSHTDCIHEGTGGWHKVLMSSIHLSFSTQALISYIFHVQA